VNEAPSGPAAASRLVSLDTFRGATMAFMVLVNNPGSWKAIYWPLDHAAWHGWTPTDLVFPLFLFIVGVSLPLSRKENLLSALRRAAILFGLGLLLNTFPFFDPWTLRIPGVLQRIALCYLAAWLVKRFTGPATQAVLAAALLVLYWWLMTRVAVPGFGPANLEPGTNLGAYVDSQVYLGAMYMKTWDPEGVLSTLPAIATTLLGLLAGAWLRAPVGDGRRVAGFVIGGALLALLGVVWGEHFPINKNLWTSSFVLFTGGLAAALFGLCHLLADVWGYQGWTRPFVVFGRNAIFLYVAAALVTRTLNVVKIGGVSLQASAYEALLSTGLAPEAASLAWALVVLAFWFAVLVAMDRRGLRFRV
jgi:predicted acyltransferase